MFRRSWARAAGALAIAGALCATPLAGCALPPLAWGGEPAEATREGTGTEEAAGPVAGEPAEAGAQPAEAGEEPTQDEALPDHSDRLDLQVLVNKEHALPEGWEQSLDLVESVNPKGNTMLLDRIAYDAFVALQAELAEAHGITIYLNSCYRSIAEQQQIVDTFTADYGEDYVRAFVAVPGHSEHHTGLALDAYLVEDGVPILTNDEIFAHQATWDVVHALLPKYGFVLRYPPDREDVTGYTYEPWHYRYVGPAAAQAIYDAGLTLEEYLGAA